MKTTRTALRLAVAASAALVLTAASTHSLAIADTTRPPDDAAGSLRHLVVGAFGSPGISVLGVNRAGAMSEAPGSPFANGPLSLALSITPDAQKVYSAHTATGTITGYRLEPDGSLSPIDGGTVLAGVPASGLAITPDGSRLFATAGGQVRSFSISPSGALTPTGAQPAQTGAISAISQVAITPDARHLVVTNYLSNSVSSFTIGPDARLTPTGPPVATGDKPVLPAFTPDGRYLYVSNESSATVSGYAVEPDGRLTPTPGSPYPTPSTPHGVAITPGGDRLYVPASGADATGDNSVAGFEIGPDGALTEQLPGSPYPVSGAIGRVVLSPDAHRMFAVEGVGDFIGAPAPPALPLPQSRVAGEPPGNGNPLVSQVHSYVVNTDGGLAPSGFPPADTGLLWSDGSTAFTTPNLGPAAALRETGRNGPARTFSAEESSDPDGSIAHYHWDFDDGHQETTTSPQITHRYDQPGEHAVTVTVTDDEGCSTELIYTGTTATCTGGPHAQARLTVS